MALPNVYYQNLGKLPEFFQRIREAQAPSQVTQQIVKDWGFTSSNDRALIPLLKAIGFLTSDGQPTKLYIDYRDDHAARRVLGEALETSYIDIFNIRSKPKPADREAIQGKFKSTHNTSDLIAGLMAKTFFALLELSDIGTSSTRPSLAPVDSEIKPITSTEPDPTRAGGKVAFSGLHYNIQIHLPATKDVEVYNAIFKSLKEHLVE